MWGNDQTYQRVRSVLTQKVKVIEGSEVSIHAAFRKVKSGQLPFLGSRQRPVCPLRLQTCQQIARHLFGQLAGGVARQGVDKQ